MQKTESEKYIKVSVVVPVFNAAKYLRQNVESLLGQSLREVEFIFVDDGSTDGSYDILLEYANKDERMHVLCNMVQSDGAALARNLGIDKAHGKYLQMVDSDDYFEMNMLERLFQTAEAHQVDMVICDAFVHDVHKDEVRGVSYLLDRKNFPMGKPFSPHDYRNSLFQISGASTWHKFYRRKFVEDKNIRFVPVRYTDDVVFTFTTMACAESIVALPERLVHYRANAPGSQSVSASNGFTESGWKADDELFKELRSRGLFETFRQTFYSEALRTFQTMKRRLNDKRDFAVLYNKIRDEKMAEWGLNEQTLDSLPARLEQEWKRIRDNDVNEYLAEGKSKSERGDRAVLPSDKNSFCTTSMRELRRKFSQQVLQERIKVFWGMDGASWNEMCQTGQRSAYYGEDFIVAPDSTFLGSFLHGMPVCSIEALLHCAVKPLVLVQRKDYANVVKRLATYGFVPGVDIVDISHLADEDGGKKVYMEKTKMMQSEERCEKMIKDMKRQEEHYRYKHRPHTLLRFEVQLAEQCNLNCKGCTHYAPIAEPEFLDLDEYGRDLARLAELFDHECRWIHLMGGEPLLHPEIARVIRLTREHFPWGKIMVVTNGLLLGQMKEDFWQACREYQVEISATKYPVACDYEKQREKARREGVRFTFYNGGQSVKTLNRYPLSQTGHQHVEDSFLRCFSSNRCLALRHGRIYGCDMAAYAHHLIRKFDLPLHESRRDSIDIYKAKSAEEIMEHCAKPIPFCRYCNVPGQTEGEPFCQSQRDRYEWIDFEGTEADWKYLSQFRQVYICTDGSQGQRLQWQCQEQGLEAQILDSTEKVKSVSDIEGDAFLLAFRNKQKRHEAEQALWDKKATNIIPTAEPPDGGHG